MDKRIVIVFGTIAAGLLILLIVLNFRSASSVQIAAIDVVQNAGQSVIHFYNKKGKNEKNLSIPYQLTEDTPIVNGDKVFLTVKKRKEGEELSGILEYDKDKDIYQVYWSNQSSVNSFGVNEEYLFYVTTFNDVSRIERIDRKTGKHQILPFPHAYIGQIAVCGTIVYAIAQYTDGESDLITINCRNLKCLYQKELSSYGYTPADLYLKDQTLYLLFQTKMVDGSEVENPALCEMNLKSHEITAHSLSIGHPYTINEYKNKLLITDYDPVRNKGNAIYLYDPKNQKEVRFTCEENPSQISIRGKQIYLLDRNKRKVTQYQIIGQKLELKQQYQLPGITKRSSFKLTGFFLTSE
ncbi:hypothetical protein lbkm_1383 [Lachnospiraceae bacterium KM106-2]|nr:hypothetical protein lbkm_1383 [Lachnospiraceae bacterium KM106-2]